jgi:class 3 adenylate cyclase
MTDIEGSTRLWEREPETMAQALVHHDTLVTATVGRAGGRLIKTKGEGDSGFAVFSTASAALAAAVDLQRCVNSTTWPTAQPLRLRLVVATGDVHHRDGDVYGLAVCRAARVRALARGDQIVVMAATAALVADAMPTGTTLTDRGTHRLDGLTRSEHVYGVDWQPVSATRRERSTLPFRSASRARNQRSTTAWALRPFGGGPR